MLEIAKRFENGKGSTSIKDLGAALSIPLSQVKNTISDLESASLIIAVNVNGSVYMLSRPARKIKIVDIVDAVFSSETPQKEKMESEGKIFSNAFLKKGVEGEDETLFDLLKESENDNR